MPLGHLINVEDLFARIGDRALVLDLAQFYLSTGAETLAAVVAAAQQRDGKVLELAAHSLKGALTIVGVETTVEAVDHAIAVLIPLMKQFESERLQLVQKGGV